MCMSVPPRWATAVSLTDRVFFSSPLRTSRFIMADNIVPQASTSAGQTNRKSPNQEAAAKVKAKSKANSGKRTCKSTEKQASRVHCALEKQFSRAQKLVVGEMDKPPLPSLGASTCGPQLNPLTLTWSPEREPEQNSIPGIGQEGPSLFGEELGPHGPPMAPAATFIPAASGLWPLQEPSFAHQLQAMISGSSSGDGFHQAPTVKSIPGPSSVSFGLA